MELEFNINGQIFYVQEYRDGWGWWNAKTESDGFFSTALEAQQDAINHQQKIEAKRAKLEEETEEHRLQLIDEGKYFNPKGGNPDKWKEENGY